SSGLWMQGPAEQMALIAARLAAATAVPRTEQDPRTMPQRRYDTILDAISAKTSVFVDLVGYANPDGTISLPALPGIGDLDPDQLGRLVTGGTLRFHNPQVKPPATDAYAWTAAQRRYVCARDRVCRFPGCQVPAERCELDHVIPFQPDGSRGATDVDNGLCVCKRHHRVKHQPGWKIQLFDDNTVVWTSPTGHTTTDQPWTADRT
ncbi:MAG TPA: HNH endonuclease signature motif containing protein, partial [Mycobacteriales bacterium]|nr:HNH endonuclease signature motif containing protein [Mycobacteriales bacterium]